MMNVEIESVPARRVAALPHLGPYPTIGTALRRLGDIADQAGLLSDPGARMIGIFRDDPSRVPAETLRSAAGLIVAPEASIPDPLLEIVLPAGRWASTLHLGSYSGLGETWRRFIDGWLARSGHRKGPTDCFEMYLNRPGEVPEDQLQTRLYLMLW